MVLPYFVLWATLMNALFVKAKWLPPLCAQLRSPPERGRPLLLRVRPLT